MRKEPIAAVILILILCAVLESWILYGTGFQYNSCITMPEYISDKWASRLHFLEIIWSYILPCILIIILDIKVLCFQNKVAAPLKSSTSFNTSPQTDTRIRSISECIIRKLTTTTETSSICSYPAAQPTPCKEDKSYQEKQKEEVINLTPRKHTKRTYNQAQVLRRCLFITLLDLSMNLPNYLFRLYLNTISPGEFENLLSQNYKWIFNFIEDLSQLLYFAQFSLNALYLVYLVYDPPKKTQMV
uniref:G-protein coupled receptors family 1 profile domain-containing protein n=1 Tax=Acrobeloides nanus TaxID=290746 RepID=A0A914DFL9_9BILA